MGWRFSGPIGGGPLGEFFWAGVGLGKEFGWVLPGDLLALKGTEGWYAATVRGHRKFKV